MSYIEPTTALVPALEQADHPGRLPLYHARLAVADILRDNKLERKTLAAAQERLWREDPELVTSLYDAAVLVSVDGGSSEGVSSQGGLYGLRAERMRKLWRPPLTRSLEGRTLNDIAREARMDRATLIALMIEQGYLETIQYGRTQRRTLVTEQAYTAELGHNVYPGKRRSIRLDGAKRSSPFPVFYPERVASILWSLDWEGVSRAVQEAGGKRERMKVAMERFRWLPNRTLAGLVGCSVQGIEKARKRGATVPYI